MEVSDAELVSPALNPEGSLLAATSYNVEWRRLTTHVWDTTTGQEIMTAGFGDQIGGLAFSPDGSMLAMPGTVGKVTIWDPTNGKQLFMVRDDNATVLDMSFSPDSRRLATANIDGTARVWDLASRERLMTMRGHEGAVYGVDFSPDGHSAEALNVAFSPDGSRLASSGSDDKTIVWDISP